MFLKQLLRGLRTKNRNNIRTLPVSEPILTHVNFSATSLNPFCSNLFMIFPTSPRWTPSGFTIMKVLSRGVAILREIKEKIAKTDMSIHDPVDEMREPTGGFASSHVTSPLLRKPEMKGFDCASLPRARCGSICADCV